VRELWVYDGAVGTLRPEECRTAGDVRSLAQAMYGGVDLAAREGVVHVTALWASPAGALLTLRINEHTPKSPHDRFALGLARARADAILVTGKVLRDEPGLRYELGGPGELPRGLAAWRAEHAGRHEPPWLLVLTSGRGLDLSHPALHGWARPLIFTGEAAAAELRQRGDAAGVEIVGSAQPSARAAIAHLRGERRARVVTIEAGPTVSRPLYDDPRAVHELMLSLFRGPEVAPQAIGAALAPSRAALVGRLGEGTGPWPVVEASGPWTFELLPLSPASPAPRL